MQRREVLVTAGIWAVATHVGSVLVKKVSAAGALDKVVGELEACLLARGCEVSSLVISAFDGLIVEGSSEDTTNEVRGWVDIVHLVYLLVERT